MPQEDRANPLSRLGFEECYMGIQYCEDFSGNGAAGEIGAAAGIAGSALSFGAAMTPLAAVAAPVLFFTALSASMKADENLEKAQTMYAQAEAASEKMKVSETLCAGISERSEMFYDVLHELDGMFLECVMLLHELCVKKRDAYLRKN